MKLQYIACLVKTDNGYSVMLTDFEGFYASGCSLLDAEKNCKEGILFHIEGMIYNKIPLPLPSNLNEVKKNLHELEVELDIELKQKILFTLIEINIV